MKYPRNVLAVFALLDAVLFLQLARLFRFSVLSANYSRWLLPHAALFSLLLVFILSLVVSAVGLAMGKKWGFIVSYVQFPFRFVFAALSFGFISRIPGMMISGSAFPPWLVPAMVLECGRLAWTILIHRRMAKPTEE